MVAAFYYVVLCGFYRSKASHAAFTYYISRVQPPRNIAASKAAAEQGASYPQIYLQIKDN